MQINENDIASIQPFGVMNGKAVNLVLTRGGLNLATMVDHTGKDTVLGAASHQAILCYTIEQRYPQFQPMIMKSDVAKSVAESHSHFLSNDLRKSGHDIYSIQSGNDVEFYITKQNIKVASATASKIGNDLAISSLNVPKEYISALSGAVSEKALSSGLTGVKVQ
jgi:hypothetical protein